jgi:hypothetical protein
LFPIFLLFMISSDESWPLYSTDLTAITTIDSVCPEIWYFVIFPKYRDSCIEKSHRLNKLHFCCFQKLDLSRFFPMDRDYFTVEGTRLKEASFMLFPIFLFFMIRYDESQSLYCTDHTAMQLSYQLGQNSMFRDSLRLIGIIVLYKSHGYKNLHFGCAQMFDISWFVQRIGFILHYRSHGYKNLHFSCVQKIDFRDSFGRLGIIVL